MSALIECVRPRRRDEAALEARKRVAHGVSRGIGAIESGQPRRGGRTVATPRTDGCALSPLTWLGHFARGTHGLRRGLLSAAALRLGAGAFRASYIAVTPLHSLNFTAELPKS